MCVVLQFGNSGAFRCFGSRVCFLCLLFVQNIEISSKHKSTNRQRGEIDKDIFYSSDDYFRFKRSPRSHVSTFLEGQSVRDRQTIGSRYFLPCLGLADCCPYHVYASLII